MEDANDYIQLMQQGGADTVAFTSVPCGVCPVFDQCCDGGLISPATCEYYNKWLEF